jgi:hypothetical protein
MQHTTETPKQYQCRHIFTDGHRCSSPCLRQEEFCYYHHTTRRPVANPKQRRSRRSTFHLPLPEDRSAIQASIGEVLQRIAANDIDPRRAGLLLYGLQIASLNLPKPQTLTKPEPQTVEEITIDPALGFLAPRTDISETARPKSAVALLIERMLQSKEEEEPAKSDINEAATEPAIVPILQATEDAPEIGVLLSSTPKHRHLDRDVTLAAADHLHSIHTVKESNSDHCHFDRNKRRWRNRFSTASVTTTSAPPQSWLLYPIPASTPRI